MVWVIMWHKRNETYSYRSNTMSDNDFSDDDITLTSGLAAFEAKHFARAVKILAPLIEKGHAEAMYRCAIIYQNGLGVHSNEAMALRMMSAAAEQGHALAQHGLGFMYMQGECVARDGERAVEWFSKAAEQGLAGSQTTLAMIYEEGTLVPRNTELASYWYKKAGF